MGVDANKLSVKSPGVVIPMTAAVSVVEFELVKWEWGLPGPKAECRPNFSRRGKSSSGMGEKTGILQRA
jgi:hypothetical protein